MSSESRPLASRDDEQHDVWHQRMLWLRIWLALSCLTLLASTWKLWTPQTVFPQIPFLAALRTAPAWLDWVAIAVMLFALVAMLALALLDRSRPAATGRDDGGSLSSRPFRAAPSPEGEGRRNVRWLRAATLLLVASLTTLVLLDQHRFQPWAYQFGIVAIVFAFAPAVRAASLLRVLTVGIYFWSAVSKLDYTFLHGLGPELLRGLLAAFRLEPGWMRPEVAVTLAWAFPLDELAVAILLAIRRSRTIGLVAAIAMHLLLLATLGPFGLDHSPGVLLWNVYFIGQNVILFRRPPAGWKATAGPNARKRFRDIVSGLGSPRPTAGIANVAVFAAMWLPILQPIGYLDYWPAWAVYAPAGERVTLFIYPQTTSTPAELKPYFSNSWGPSFLHSRFDVWSLDALGVPISPDGRFHTGVGLSVVERYGLTGFDASLSFVERADRFTGERDTFRIDGVSQFRPVVENKYWINALPRKLGGW